MGGICGSHASDEEQVYEMVSYSYKSGFVQGLNHSVPPQDYQYSTLVNVQDYLYVFGGLKIRNPIIYRNRVFQDKNKNTRIERYWENIDVKGLLPEYFFEFRRFLGVCKYSNSPDETRLIVFGGMRKMQQMETWCIVQVDHKDKSVEILEEVDGKKIQNKKDGEFMCQAGAVE